jgi:hypothetical protein
VAETITTACYIAREKIVIGGYKEITCADVRGVLKMTRARKETALEFVLQDGKSYLVDFTPSDAGDVVKALRICKFERIEWLQKTPFKDFFRKVGDTAAWVERRVSNFDYLM